MDGKPSINASKVVNVGKKVDIVLVVQSDEGTFDWMGFDSYKCPTGMCIEPEPSVTWHIFGWWGYPLGYGYPSIYSGEVSVSDPSVILIGRSHNGPFSSGPFTVDYTYNEYDHAYHSERVYVIAEGVGTASVQTCISYNGPWCDPSDESQDTHQERTHTVSPSKVIFHEHIGLRDIGTEIVDALEQRFSDYRFGLIIFGYDPELYFSDEDWMFPEWKPHYVDPQPYYDWIPLTNDASVITQGLSNLSLICNYPYDGYVLGTTAYTAMLHAINDTPWREDADKVIILYQERAVDYYNRTSEVELVSGNTLEMVVNRILSEDISLYTFLGGWNARELLEKLTQSTSGTYYDYVWPPLTGLETALNDIASLGGSAASLDGSAIPKVASNDIGNETTNNHQIKSQFLPTSNSEAKVDSIIKEHYSNSNEAGGFIITKTDSGLTVDFKSANLEEKEEVPTQYTLGQNYPNPFNPTTVITYQLPIASKVNLKVYDVLGKEVTILVNEKKPAGNYEVEFDGSELTSGIYFYRIQAGDFVETKIMMLQK